MNATKIISIILLLSSVGLAFFLGTSIKSSIDDKELIAQQEQAIIEKLQLIREAEEIYQEVNGNYTSDWNKLITFIKNGTYPIIERKERVVTLSYGADSSIVTFDTLGMISARQRIFEQTHNINAANSGTFESYSYNSGQEVEKGNNAYTLNQNGRLVTHKFKQSGVISNVQNLSKGASVVKGDLLMSLLENKFNSNIDLDRLAYVPGHDNVKFEIYAAEIDKSGVLVDVIEVKNPRPINPARSEDNDAKNKKPLRFGSKTDVTTSGNWE